MRELYILVCKFPAEFFSGTTNTGRCQMPINIKENVTSENTKARHKWALTTSLLYYYRYSSWFAEEDPEETRRSQVDRRFSNTRCRKLLQVLQQVRAFSHQASTRVLLSALSLALRSVALLSVILFAPSVVASFGTS